MTTFILEHPLITYLVAGALLALSITWENKVFPVQLGEDVLQGGNAFCFLGGYTLGFIALVTFDEGYYVMYINIILGLTVGITVSRILWYFRRKLFIAPYQKYRAQFAKHVPSSHQKEAVDSKMLRVITVSGESIEVDTSDGACGKFDVAPGDYLKHGDRITCTIARNSAIEALGGAFEKGTVVGVAPATDQEHDKQEVLWISFDLDGGKVSYTFPWRRRGVARLLN